MFKVCLVLFIFTWREYVTQHVGQFLSDYVKCMFAEPHSSDLTCQYRLLEDPLRVPNIAALRNVNVTPVSWKMSISSSHIYTACGQWSEPRESSTAGHSNFAFKTIIPFSLPHHPSEGWAAKVHGHTFVLHGLNFKQFIELNIVIALVDIGCQCSAWLKWVQREWEYQKDECLLLHSKHLNTKGKFDVHIICENICLLRIRPNLVLYHSPESQVYSDTSSSVKLSQSYCKENPTVWWTNVGIQLFFLDRSCAIVGGVNCQRVVRMPSISSAFGRQSWINLCELWNCEFMFQIPQ